MKLGTIDPTATGVIVDGTTTPLPITTGACAYVAGDRVFYEVLSAESGAIYSVVVVANMSHPVTGGTKAVSAATFFATGTLAVATGQHRFYIDATTATITMVRAAVGTASAGASVLVNPKKNGTAILGSPLAIAAGSHTSYVAANVGLVFGDYLTVDVTQVGSSTAGSDLTVQIEMG